MDEVSLDDVRSACGSRGLLLGGLVLLGPGLIFLALLTFTLADRARFAGGVHTRATVTNVQSVRLSGGNAASRDPRQSGGLQSSRRSYSGTVVWEDAQGKVYSKDMALGSTETRDVDVVYLVADPSQMRIAAGLKNPFPPICFGALGLLFAPLGILAIVRARTAPLQRYRILSEGKPFEGKVTAVEAFGKGRVRTRLRYAFTGADGNPRRGASLFVPEGVEFLEGDAITVRVAPANPERFEADVFHRR